MSACGTLTQSKPRQQLGKPLSAQNLAKQEVRPLGPVRAFQKALTIAQV